MLIAELSGEVVALIVKLGGEVMVLVAKLGGESQLPFLFEEVRFRFGIFVGGSDVYNKLTGIRFPSSV